MQEITNEKLSEKTRERVNLPLSWQLIGIVTLFLWSFIIIRVSLTVTEKEFVNWVSAVALWVIITVFAVFGIELFLLSFFYKKLVNAPLVLFSVFVILVTINVFIVIIVLYAMGFVSGVPPIGVT